MEVQTAARALEAAGRVDRPHGDRRARFPDAGAGDRRGAARDRGRRHLLHVGARPARAARRRSPRHYATTTASTSRPSASSSRPARRRRCCSCMALLVNRDDRILLADPGYPCNRHFVRVLEGEPVGIPVGRRHELPAHGGPDRAELDAVDARRADCLAVESDRHHRAARRDGADRRGRRALGGQLIVDEIYLGLTYDGDAARARSTVDDDAFVISSFSKYFNMTGWRLGWIVAPERHVRDLEKLAQNLYISPPTPSQRAALACFEPETLAIVEARRQRVRGAARFPGAGAARAGIRHSGDADRRLFRLRRHARASRDDSERVLPRRARSTPAWRSRRASTSAAIARSDHVRFAYTIGAGASSRTASRACALPAR